MKKMITSSTHKALKIIAFTFSIGLLLVISLNIIEVQTNISGIVNDYYQVSSTTTLIVFASTGVAHTFTMGDSHFHCNIQISNILRR